MRLNIDCIRDILLCVEENTSLRKLCVFVDSELCKAATFACDIQEPANYQLELLEKYDNDTLIYHVFYCIKAGLLSESDHSDSCTIWIEDLTPDGHDFVANIRSRKNHTWLKNAATKIGSESLPVLMQIAAEHVLSQI